MFYFLFKHLSNVIISTRTFIECLFSIRTFIECFIRIFIEYFIFYSNIQGRPKGLAVDGGRGHFQNLPSGNFLLPSQFV